MNTLIIGHDLDGILDDDDQCFHCTPSSTLISSVSCSSMIEKFDKGFIFNPEYFIFGHQLNFIFGNTNHVYKMCIFMRDSLAQS